MAQFNFKCPQCGESIEADDSLCGQVAECPSCGKGIVVPHNAANTSKSIVRLRPVARKETPMPSSASAPEAARRLSEFERMSEKEAQRRRQEMRQEGMMLLAKVVVLLVLIGGAGTFGFMKWRDAKRIEAQRLLEQREAEQAAEREEAERKKEEKEKKDAAFTAFQAYLAREEARIKDKIEAAKIACESIDIDCKELSEELERIEKEDARLAALSKKRGEFRYDKAEHVLLILKSQGLGSLYEKYCGEDLTATRAKFENEVNTLLKMHRESTTRLRKNKEKYYAAVKGINEEVEQKNEAALRRARSAKSQTQGQLNKLRERKRQLEKRLSDEQNKRVVGVNTSISGKVRETNGAKNRRQRIASLTAEIESIDRDIATAEALESGNRAQMAHLEATTAETSARRKFDTALEVRQSDDNDVHEDMRHKGDIYLVAGRYEQITLDKLRTAMRISSEFQAAKAAEARKKLDYITHSTANLELMNADEIENVRKRIVAKLAEDIVDKEGEKSEKPENE